MVQTPAKPITLDEFLALPETKPASEFIDQVIIQKPMPQGQHSTIQAELVTTLNGLGKPQNLAWAFPELRCTFGNRSIVPDIAVFSWDHLPTNPDGTIANLFQRPPDWTIEILSPEQSIAKVTKTIIYCLNHGTQLGWLIIPGEQLVFVYHPNRAPQFFESRSDRLPTPALLSDLNLTVGELFDWLRVD